MDAGVNVGNTRHIQMPLNVSVLNTEKKNNEDIQILIGTSL